MSSQKRPAPATRDRDTERRILEAARRVFVRRGTAGARMQEIAEEADVNPALLHYYFRSKERLAATVFRGAAERLLPAVVSLLGSDAPLDAKVERFVHLYIDTVRDHPFLPGYVVSELHQHPEHLAAMLDEAAVRPAEIAAAVRTRLGAQLRERAAAGKMRPMTVEQFLVSLIGLVAAPFLARPVLETLFGMNERAFARFLARRRAELPGFIMSALRP